MSKPYEEIALEWAREDLKKVKHQRRKELQLQGFSEKYYQLRKDETFRLNEVLKCHERLEQSR